MACVCKICALHSDRGPVRDQGGYAAALRENVTTEVDLLLRLLWGQIVGLCLWSCDETLVIPVAQQHIRLKEKVMG